MEVNTDAAASKRRLAVSASYRDTRRSDACDQRRKCRDARGRVELKDASKRVFVVFFSRRGVGRSPVA